MKTLGLWHSCAWVVVIAVFALAASQACRTGGGNTPSAHPRPEGEASADALVAHFGGRAPRPCPAIAGKPTDAEATVLLQCTSEGPFGTIETLMTNVTAHITGSRPINPGDAMDQHIDTRGTLYTLTASANVFSCGDKSFMPGQNCLMQQLQNAPGTCWKTTYGEYRCTAPSVLVGWHPNQPPPAQY